MDNLHHTLDAIVKHLDLLGWHVKQLRETGAGTVAEEIDSGLNAIKDAMTDLQDDLDDYDKTRENVRTVMDLGLVQDAINCEREYEEAMADAADASRY